MGFVPVFFVSLLSTSYIHAAASEARVDKKAIRNEAHAQKVYYPGETPGGTRGPMHHLENATRPPDLDAARNIARELAERQKAQREAAEAKRAAEEARREREWWHRVYKGDENYGKQ